ncbi:MAG TPA: recombinase family protein [Pseudonocardiaceae bacterium]|nr:recombinase family protein [Pseudonocardiaceae bacterium]
MSAAATRRRTVATLTRQLECVLYLRLSDLRDDELDAEGNGETFVDREQDLRDFVENDLRGTVVTVIIENDLSRKNGKQRNASAFKRRRVTLPDGTVVKRVIRPGFDNVLELLASGEANCLVTEDSDRITRDQFDGGRLIDLVEANGLDVRTLTGAFNLTHGGTDTEIGAAWDAINKANQESRKIANRVRRGRARKARRGEFGGGRRPYGFESDGVTKRWDECLVVQIASHQVLTIDGRPGREGKLTSLRLIAAEMRDAGLPSASGSPWTAEMLREILLRPRNAGILVHRGEEFCAAPWSPIVPLHIFRAVQRVLTDPSRRTNEQRGRAVKWLGSGLYLCGVEGCGATMEVHRGSSNAPKYRCKTSSHLSRAAAALDDYVRRTLVERLSLPDTARMFAAPRGRSVDVVALQREASAIRVNLDQLAADKVLGKIDQGQLRAGTVAANARLVEITQALAQASPTSDSPLVALLSARDVAAAFDRLPLLVQREVLATLMTVTVLPSRPGAQFDHRRIDITWRQHVGSATA